MDLRDALQAVVEAVDGALAGIIMGFDGVPLEEYRHPDCAFDVAATAVEYTTALGEVRRTSESLGFGDVHELSVGAVAGHAVMRPINDAYFLVLFLAPTANIGQGRYYLRRAARQVAPELT